MLIPNGVDTKLFRAVLAGDVKPNPIYDNKTRPVVGFYGSIASWVDIDLIVTAARVFPDIDFIVIGPDYNLQFPNLGVPNIKRIGFVPYEDIPGYLAGFDIAMIPFKNTPMTKAVSPLKAFEYLAAGRPVVTTLLPELVGINGVYVSDTPYEFIGNIHRALAELSTLSKVAISAGVSNYSWEYLTTRIVDRIQSLLITKGLSGFELSGCMDKREC
jgi:glycosyltransferase involved in cell wall biosynthesis